MRAVVRFSSLFLLFLACQSVNDAYPVVRTIDHDQLREIVGRNKGKVVLVNVWATWCAPCREEMPALLRIRKKLQGKGFELILVSTDDPELLRTKVQPMLKEFGVDFPTYINVGGSDEAFITALSQDWSGALPTSFLYDRGGKMVDMLVGAKSYEQFAKTLEALLSS